MYKRATQLGGTTFRYMHSSLITCHEWQPESPPRVRALQRGAPRSPSRELALALLRAAARLPATDFAPTLDRGAEGGALEGASEGQRGGGQKEGAREREGT